jgi:hypothetical protein
MYFLIYKNGYVHIPLLKIKYVYILIFRKLKYAKVLYSL